MNLFVILVINVTMFFIVTTLLYIHAYLPIPGQCTDFVINVFLVTVYFMVPYCTVHLYLPPGVPGLLEGAGDPLPPGAVPLPLQGIVHGLGGLLLFG